MESESGGEAAERIVHEPTGRCDPRVVVATRSAGVAAECYRLLAERLLAATAVGPRRIGFTSPSPGEGRTLSALNTALALAPRASVALVECDLRAPSLHALLGLPPTAGLTDVLAGRVPLERALVRYGQPPIHVLTSGDATVPHEAIASPRLAELLATLAEQFALVIVDAPAALPSADVATLGRAIDRWVMVVRAGRTRREEIERALDRLPVGSVLGFVMAGASESGSCESPPAERDRWTDGSTAGELAGGLPGQPSRA